jgi:hypothetical protein
MKPNPKAHGLSDSPFARCESGFEKADIGLLAEPSIQARFGRTLKKLFPLPSEHSEPNEMHILLQKIQAKLENISEGQAKRTNDAARTKAVSGTHRIS